MIDNSSIDIRNEIYRKGIHLSSLIIPVLFYFLDRTVALQFLIPFTFLFIFIDLGRFYNKKIAKLFYKIFKSMLRKHETNHKLKRLNGGSFVMLSATISIFLFPKYIAIASFSILTISDTFAALIGRFFGFHKFINNKTFEGSLTFFLSAIFVILLTPKYNYLKTEYLIGFTGAFVGTIIELLPIPIDDNLTIPLSIGLTMWWMYLTFLPTLNLAF